MKIAVLLPLRLEGKLLEKGKLTNISINNGVVTGTIELDNKEKIAVPPGFRLDWSMKGKIFQIQREKGKIVKILIDGKELTQAGINAPKNNYRPNNKPKYPQNHQKDKSVGGEKKGINNYGHMATAPYNFVALNNVVLDETEGKYGKLDTYGELNGYIDLEIETITPTYIRNTSPLQGQDSEHEAKFFSPGESLKIPGSSLRGMIRTLVEIVSYGKFVNFEDRLLYYRGLADKCKAFRNEYQANMAPFDFKTKKSAYMFEAGFLVREGFKHFIIPAQKINGKQFTNVRKKNSQDEFKYERQSDGKYLVVSGKMQGKKNDWLINEPDYNAPRLTIPSKDIEAYEKDENRFADDKDKKPDASRRDGNLLRMLKCSDDKMVPCFYVRWKDSEGKDRISFGHTGYFRLAYKYSIGDHVPKVLRQKEVVDMNEAIFGKEGQFASRVFFEDAVLVSKKEDVLMETVSPKILASPKPTTFQHYLEQKVTDITKLSHWNSQGVPIRGYKLYWHKNPEETGKFGWSEGKIIKDTQHTTITPIKSGSRFNGRIRFENLTAVELGALLFTISFPPDHYHKLGMAKSLGLGSVKITSSLKIIDRLQRYKGLFSDATWGTGIKETEIQSYIGMFEKHIIDNLKSKGALESEVRSLWEIPRLKGLKAMLSWAKTKSENWTESTSYMEFGRDTFPQRRVLPGPTEV